MKQNINLSAPDRNLPVHEGRSAPEGRCAGRAEEALHCSYVESP